MNNRKPAKNNQGQHFEKKKYSFKIAGCQHQIKRVIITTDKDDEWLKKFYLN